MFVPGIKGDGPTQILALFEKPSDHETGACRCEPGRHDTGEPLVGPTGRIVEQSIGGWEGVYRTYVRKCTTKAKDDAEDAATIAHCTQAYLTKELETLTAEGTVKVVLLGGADAAACFYPEPNVVKLQGGCYTRDEIEAINGLP